MSESGPPQSMRVPISSLPARSLPPRVAPVPAPARGLRFGYLALLPAVAIALATANPTLTVAAVLTLALVIRLLWRPGQPPALVLACGLQWIQAALMTLHADVRGVEVWTMSYSRSIELSTYVTLGWVFSTTVGAWLVTRNLMPSTVAASSTSPISMQRLLMVYGAWTIAEPVLAHTMPVSMLQVYFAMASMRFALVFAVFTHGWRQLSWRPIIILVLLFEVGVGFLGFFANFRLPLYVFALALATAGYRPTLRQWVGFAVVFTLTVYLGVVWSAIKMDYRDRISGGLGHRTQEVRVSVEERAESFLELLGTVDGRVLADGAEALVTRLSYVEYCAYVLDYVPSVVDFERGKLWGRAITHVLVPRMFFPDKEPLPDDTAVTERYTGLNLGSGSGTSISIGIVGESYIDFGLLGPIAMGFLFGIMIGFGYRFFIVQRHYGVLAQGIAVSMCLTFGSIEAGPAKTLGGFLSLFLISAVTWRLFLPPLWPWLTGATASRK